MCETFMTEDLPASFYTVSDLLRKRKTEPRKRTAASNSGVHQALCQMHPDRLTFNRLVVEFFLPTRRHPPAVAPTVSAPLHLDSQAMEL